MLLTSKTISIKPDPTCSCYWLILVFHENKTIMDYVEVGARYVFVNKAVLGTQLVARLVRHLSFREISRKKSFRCIVDDERLG